MNDTIELRTALAGLLSFAAAEEQALLAAAAFCPDYDRGSPDRWAAVPVVAHNNQFKSQQTERILAIRSGQLPAVYGEVDHSPAEVYQDCSAQPPDAVLAECRRVSAELIDGTWALPDEDLLDPARNSWLNGRMPTPAGTPTCGSCEKLSPEEGPAGSLACSGTRREEFCVSCRQLRPSAGTGHAYHQIS